MFLKKLFSFLLSFLLLFQGNAPFLSAFAQEATESATQTIVEPIPTPEPTPEVTPTPEPSPEIAPMPEPIPTPTPAPEWQTVDGVDVITQPVAEGHTYRYRETAVTLTFIKVTQPGLLKIKEVKVGEDTGYDITSDMPDGTFSYDLTLPNPNPTQDAKVKYSEDGQTYQELSAEKQNDTLVIRSLDHFTIFVVTNPSPPPANYLQDVVDNSDPGFEILSGTWRTSTSVPGYYGSNYITTDDHTSTGQVRWNFSPTQSGTQEVFTRWTTSANRGTAVPFMVTYDGGSTTITVNQELDNGTWVSLGTYPFTAGNLYSVTLTNNSTSTSDFVIGDAIKLQNVSDPAEVWVDGSWTGTPDGTDLGSGKIFGYSAFSTIQSGIDGVATRGTVNIVDGTYAENITTSKSLILEGQSQAGVVIDNSGVGTGISVSASNVTVKKLTVQNFSSGNGIEFLGGGDPIVPLTSELVDQVTIFKNGDGINLYEVNGITISNSSITDNGYVVSGIHILDSSGVIVSGDTFSGNVVDIYNDSLNDVTATDNNWGTDNYAEIESRVYHGVDDPSLGIVDFGSPTNGLAGISSYVTANFSGTSSLTSGDGKLIISDTDSDATFAIAQYSGDPSSGGITIATPFGSYYDIQYFGTPVWPVNIRLNYTPADLTPAGIVENQLLGLYYNSGTSWNIYSDDGQSTTGVDAVNDYLWADAYHFTPIIAAADTTPPSAPGTPATTPDPTNSISQTWDWTASTDDASGSGILGYWYRSPEAGIDLTPVGNVLTWPTNFSIEGLYNFYVLAEDMAGNKGPESNGTVTVDTTPPDSATLIINSDATYTNSTTVNLDISATDNLSEVTEMNIANESSYAGWESYSTFRVWDFASGTADGVKTVHAKFKDAAGNANGSWLAKDTIILDRDAPVITDPSINNLTTNNNNYVRDGDTVNLTATITDTYQADITTDLITADLTGLGGGDVDSPDTYDPSTGLATWANLIVSGSGDGPVTVLVDAQDVAGNSAGQASDDIQADNTSPQVNSAQTQDLDSNGQIDAIKLSFDEDINTAMLSLGDPDGWDVGGYSGESIATGSAANVLILNFTESGTPDTASTPAVTYIPTGGAGSTHDIAGNELGYYYAEASEDSAPPVLLTSLTADSNTDYRLDSINLTFSENINDDRLNPETADGWDVVGYEGESISSGNGSYDNALVLSFTPGSVNDTGALPEVTYTPAPPPSRRIIREIILSTHDLADNELLAVTKIPADSAAPEVAWTTPAADSTISGTTSLVVDAKDNDQTGIKSTQFRYRADGEEGFHDIAGTSWDTTPLALGKYILQAEVTDNADNVTAVEEPVYVAAVISNIYGHTIDTTRIEITWNTDRPTDGRIIYDTVNHSSIDPAASPNYGYANSTGTEHVAPDYGTSHGIVVGGLGSDTAYYWRIVSAGTPVVISAEGMTRTYSEASAGGGGGGGGGGAVVNIPVPVPPAPAAVLGVATEEEEVEEEILPTPTPTPQPSPTPQIQGATTFNFNWWLVIVPAALLGLIISGLLLWRRT